MSVTLDSLHLDLLLLGFGLAALACVMAFLVIRPGRKGRTEVAALLSQPLNASPDRIEPVSAPRSAPTLPDHSIFISYRRIDSGDIVGRLYDHLTSQLGQNAVFKDVDSIRPGGDFRTQLEASLNACRVFLCVMGDQWAGVADPGSRSIDNPDDFVRIEVETALRRAIPVIPVFVRGLTMPAQEFFPESLRDLAFRQGLPLRADPDFRNDVTRLVASLNAVLEAALRKA